MTINANFAPAQVRPLERATRIPVPATIAVVVGSGLGFGALTAWAQGWVPESAFPLVNSAGPWVLIAFAAAMLTRTWFGAVAAGVTVLALLEVGYVVEAQAGGYTSGASSVAFWLTAALLAGPAVGLAGHWVRRADARRAALGAGLIAGVLVGEAIHFRVDTQALGYPRAELALAAGLLLVTAMWRFPRPGPVVLALATSVPTAALVLSFLRMA